MSKHALVLTLAMVVGSGCDAAATLLAPGPQPCAAVYAAVRCELIAEHVAGAADRDPTSIASLTIQPAPPGQYLSTPPTTVVATFKDGWASSTKICSGISSAWVPMCMDEAHLIAHSVTMGGYRDVPCAGEPPAGCATPHPPPDPVAQSAAEPILLDQVEIPIDHVGPYEVALGQGSLPNGILTEASFGFLDDWPEGVRISGGHVLLEVRSLEPDGKPFDNYYSHGWREGVERVDAVLVFEVDRAEPDATLIITDVVVR